VKETSRKRKRQTAKTVHEEEAEKVEKAGNFPEAVQPDDGYFGAAETCSCNLQLLRYSCALKVYISLLCRFEINRKTPDILRRVIQSVFISAAS